MFDTILIFVAALLLLGAVAGANPGIRRSASRPRFWIGIMGVASLLSLASAVRSARRHSGTGWQTSFGWPKSWYGRWQSFEDGQISSGYNLLYFAGNTLFYAAVLLVAWLFWRMIKR